VLLSVWPGVFASAQTVEDQPLPLPPAPPKGPIGQFHLGRFVVTPTITFGNVGIDTNVYNAAGERKPTLTLSAGPQILVKYNSRRMMIDSRWSAAYTYFKTYPGENGLSPTMDITANYRVGPRITLTTWDRLVFEKERPSVEIDARTRRVTADVSGSVGIAFTQKLSLGIGMHQRQFTYAAGQEFRGVDLKPNLDQTQKDYGVGLTFKLTPYTTLSGGESFGVLHFPLSTGRDGYTTGPFFGVTFADRAAVSGDVRVGLSHFHSREGTLSDSDSITLNGRVLVPLTPTTGLSALMNRNLSASYLPNAPYYQYSNYEVAIQQRLSRLFDIGFGASHWINDYSHFAEPAGATTSPAILKPETIDWYGPSFGFTPHRFGRLAVYVTEMRRQSNDPRNNFKDLRVGFMVTAGHWLTFSNSGIQTLYTPWGLNYQTGHAVFSPGF